MQYYGGITSKTAKLIVALMIIDPFIQNAIQVAMVNYVLSSGCCVSLPVQRALLLFTIIYVVATLAVQTILAISFIQGLTPASMSSASQVMVCVICLLNLNYLMTGLVPSFHHMFNINSMFKIIRQAALRNIPQIIILLTIIGLLCMNIHTQVM
jgi:hypothetical protein